MSNENNDSRLNNASTDPNRTIGVNDLDKKTENPKPLSDADSQFGFRDLRSNNPDMRPLDANRDRETGFNDILTDIRKSNYTGEGVPPLFKPTADASLDGKTLTTNAQFEWRDPLTWKVDHSIKLGATFDTFTQPGTLTPFTDLSNPRNTWDIGNITSTGKLQTFDLSGKTRIDDQNVLSGSLNVANVGQPGQTTTVGAKIENEQTDASLAANATLTQTSKGEQQITAADVSTNVPTDRGAGYVYGKVGTTFNVDSGAQETLSGQFKLRPSNDPNVFSAGFDLNYPKDSGKFSVGVASDSGTKFNADLQTNIRTGDVQSYGTTFQTPIFEKPKKEPEPGDKVELVKTGEVNVGVKVEPPKDQVTVTAGVQNHGTGIQAGVVTKEGEAQKADAKVFTPVNGGVLTAGVSIEPPKDQVTANLDFTKKDGAGAVDTQFAIAGTFQEGQLKAGSATTQFKTDRGSDDEIAFKIGGQFDNLNPASKTSGFNFGLAGKNGDEASLGLGSVKTDQGTSRTADLSITRPLSESEKLTFAASPSPDVTKGSITYSNSEVNVQRPGSHSLAVGVSVQSSKVESFRGEITASLTPNAVVIDPKYKTSDTYFIGADGAPKKLDYTLDAAGMAAQRKDREDPAGAAKRAEEKQEAKQGLVDARIAGLPEKDQALFKQSLESVREYNASPGRRGDALPELETASSVFQLAKKEKLNDVDKVYLGNPASGGPNLFVESSTGQRAHGNALSMINTNEHVPLNAVEEMNKEQAAAKTETAPTVTQSETQKKPALQQ
jgi:hypothetical protein